MFFFLLFDMLILVIELFCIFKFLNVIFYFFLNLVFEIIFFLYIGFLIVCFNVFVFLLKVVVFFLENINFCLIIDFILLLL